MISRVSAFQILLGLAAVVVFSVPILADTIHLKDGGLIKGTVVGFTSGRFTVVVGEGSRRREFTLSADEVASIEFEPVPASNSTSRLTTQQDPKVVPVSSRTTPKVVVNGDIKPLPPATSQPSPAPTSSVSNTARKNPPSLSQDVKPSVRQPVTTSDNPVRSSSSTPVSLNFKVLADNTANGWTNSGFVVKKGQRIRVSGDGTVSLGRGQTSTPGGVSEIADPNKLLKAVPTGALIAVIGDDNNDFIYIGVEREFTAARDGALYLGVNEGELSDNSGAYTVKIEIIPEIGR